MTTTKAAIAARQMAGKMRRAERRKHREKRKKERKKRQVAGALLFTRMGAEGAAGKAAKAFGWLARRGKRGRVKTTGGTVDMAARLKLVNLAIAAIKGPKKKMVATFKGKRGKEAALKG